MEADWDLIDDDPVTLIEERELRERYKDTSVGTYHVGHFDWGDPARASFAQRIAKYVAREVEVRPGREIRTQCGWTFRPDIVISGDRRVIGVEVPSGKVLRDHDRDCLRDTLLLAGGFIHVFYRFEGSVGMVNADDCLLFLSRYERKLFDLKGKEQLIPRLASRTLGDAGHLPENGVTIFGAMPDPMAFDGVKDIDPGPKFFHVSRHTLQSPTVAAAKTWIDSAWSRTDPIPFEEFVQRYKEALRKTA